jgi:hypothetical protein
MPEVRCFGMRSEVHADGYTWLDANGLSHRLDDAVRAWRQKWGLVPAAA